MSGRVLGTETARGDGGLEGCDLAFPEVDGGFYEGFKGDVDGVLGPQLILCLGRLIH